MKTNKVNACELIFFFLLLFCPNVRSCKHKAANWLSGFFFFVSFKWCVVPCAVWLFGCLAVFHVLFPMVYCHRTRGLCCYSMANVICGSANCSKSIGLYLETNYFVNCVDASAGICLLRIVHNYQMRCTYVFISVNVFLILCSHAVIGTR